MAEIDSYLAGDRLVCLRCGKPFRKLGVHVLSIHAMTVDDYRALYGLPWSIGLSGEETKIRQGNAMRKSYATGALIYNKDRLKHARQAWTTPRRRPIPAFKEIALQNLNQKEWPEDTFDKFLALMQKGLLPYEILKLPNMPGRGWFNAKRRDAANNARFLSIFDAMPFDYQRRSTLGMSERFWREVARLRQEVKSDHKVAAALGVTAMTINIGRRKRGIP